MSLLLSVVIGQVVMGGQTSRPPSAGRIDVAYDRRRETTFSGVVTGKTKGSVPGRSQGMSILVRTGKTVREVEIGPAWFVSRQEASVVMNDKVTVTGMPVVIGRRQRVVIARQIKRGRSILALRDLQGNPYWSVRRDRVASKVEMSGMGTGYVGTIGGMKTFDMNGESYAGYVLQTPNGPVNVAVAPTWYWQNQDRAFNVGDQVTFYGQGATNFGGVILVNSATYNGGSIILRPGGVNPIYGGFHSLP